MNKKPFESMEKMESKYNTCISPSMYPTLQAGDGIELYTYKAPSEMRVGDVIVYPHPNGSVDVVHRIIRINPDGVITRGDNNNKIDPYTVSFDDIIGKVIAAKRRDRYLCIRGGRTGFLIHRLMLLRKYTRPWVLLPFRMVSNAVAAWGVLNVFHSALNLQIVRVRRNHRDQCILVSGNRAVCRQLADTVEWQIRFPYKLFVNKRRLKNGVNH